jgi:hypothetical protein
MLMAFSVGMEAAGLGEKATALQPRLSCSSVIPVPGVVDSVP